MVGNKRKGSEGKLNFALTNSKKNFDFLTNLKEMLKKNPFSLRQKLFLHFSAFAEAMIQNWADPNIVAYEFQSLKRTRNKILL